MVTTVKLSELPNGQEGKALSGSVTWTGAFVGDLTGTADNAVYAQTTGVAPNTTTTSCRVSFTTTSGPAIVNYYANENFTYNALTNDLGITLINGHVPAYANAANTFSAVQTFTNSDIRLLGSSTGYTTFTSANSGASNFALTFPAVTDTVAGITLQQSSKSADYTLVLADAGTEIYHPSTDNNARAFTIPANASVAYPIGTLITFTNAAATSCTIPITSDTMTLAGSTTTGTRTLAQNGTAVAAKKTSTTWIISGVGLT